MKEYIDLKFWKMFSGFITLLALGVILLIALKIHENRQAETYILEASTTDTNQ